MARTTRSAKRTRNAQDWRKLATAKLEQREHAEQIAMGRTLANAGIILNRNDPAANSLRPWTTIKRGN